METTVLKVNGMTCGGCVRSVKTVLEKIQGVTAAEVSLEKGQAVVTHDPAKASLSRLREAVIDAGYEVA